jgi:hypothetical protein
MPGRSDSDGTSGPGDWNASRSVEEPEVALAGYLTVAVGIRADGEHTAGFLSRSLFQHGRSEAGQFLAAERAAGLTAA